MPILEGMEKDKPKHPGGRPTKYRPEFCDLTEYLAHCKKEKDLPSITGLAVFYEVAEKTVYNWGKEFPEFLQSLGRLLTISKQALMSKGLRGDWTSTITKLILSSDHGMRERIDQTSDDGPILLSSILTEEELLRRMKRSRESSNGLDFRSIEGDRDT